MYVVDQGWHTGLVVAGSDLDESLRNLLWGPTPPLWIEFGWGDEDFYLASGYSVWLAFKAAFFSSGSVLQAAGFSESPEQFFRNSNLFKLRVQSRSLATLNDKIKSTIYVGADGVPVKLEQSLYGHGNFYKATGNFSLFNTCNSWSSAILAAMECPVESGATRASTISNQLFKAAADERARGFIRKNYVTAG